MRRFPRPSRQVIRLGNVLPPVTGEIMIRRLTPEPGQLPNLKLVPGAARTEQR